MKKTFLNILIVCLCVLAGFLVASLIGNCHRKPEVRVEYKTDTIRETKIDTLTFYKPSVKRDTVIDYVFVPSDTVLEVVQRHYFEDSAYDAWVSGIEPLALDSVRVYPKTEFVTVTNTITNTILDERWRMYGFGGFSHVCERFVPEVGISISSPQKWLISAKIGYDTKLGTTYGINIGYKIF